MLKSHTKRGLLICMVATAIVLMFDFFEVLNPLELKALDFRFAVRGTRDVHKDIVVIDIDEKSINELGRWPWTRSVHADLIDVLTQVNPKAIAFDTLFTEEEKSNPASDQALAESSAMNGKVVHALFFGGTFEKLQATKPVFPVDTILNEDPYVGFVNMETDRDGVTRRVKLLGMVDMGDGTGALYGSLPVMALMASQESDMETLLPELPVDIEEEDDFIKNDMIINFVKPTANDYGYPTYSYVDVLNGNIDINVFQDKLIFVGATATALFDMRANPFISEHPGVFFHANVLDNLLQKNWIRKPVYELSHVFVIFVGLLLGFLLPRFPTWGQLGLFIAVLVGWVFISIWTFSNWNLAIKLVPPLLATVGCYGGILFHRLVIEEREKRKIKGSFKQYLSPKVIDVITKDPDKLKLGGEEREVTIFFLDIAGFTTMSEALNPSQLVEVMNECLTKFSRIIMKNDGLINKYIGDCIMAFWNSPVDQPRHASQACHAALECIAAIPEINASFEKKGLPSIDCRIGINTGDVVVGNMGSNERFDYTVMGDPVNLASRLEGANKQYKTHIMISEATFEQAKEEVEARDLDLIRVKGKKEPKKVFELICKRGELTDQMSKARKLYHNALHSYRKMDFEEAIHSFQEVFDYMPNDHLARTYLERARTFKITPPPANWDGVFEMKTK